MNEWDRLGGAKLEDNIGYILISRFNCQICSKKDSKKYKENLIEYRNFIKEASMLVSALSLPNNSISLSIALSMLIKNGAFSVNNEFISKNSKEKAFLESGIEVVKGMGVCRNVSGFQKNVFEELGIPIEEYSCNLDDKNRKDDIDGESNHMANVIIYNGVHYVSDVYNDLLGSFVDSNFAKSFDDIYFYYKPDYLMRYSYLEKEEIIERLNKYKKSSLAKQITKKEYDEIDEETVMTVINNRKLVDEFKEDTVDLKQRVIKKVR